MKKKRNHPVLRIIRKELYRFLTDKKILVSILLPGVLIFALYSLMGDALLSGFGAEERGELTVAAVGDGAVLESLAEAHAAVGGAPTLCVTPTDESESVVNGMSPSHRNSPYANSGFVTEIREEDFAHLSQKYGALAGLVFQQQLEQRAREQAPERQTAPAQRVADFVARRASASLPKCSYVPGIVPSRLDEWMPQFMATRLREAISIFDKRMKGYLTNEAVVVGVESRTSTPVRIPRDRDTLQHPEIEGLYPAGEGAGFAGGIISAALDGERIAEAIKDTLSPFA